MTKNIDGIVLFATKFDLLNKYSQSTDPNMSVDPGVSTSPEATQTNMSVNPNANTTPATPAKQVAKQKFQPIPKTTQQALNALGFKGKNGKELIPDGQLGPETYWAVMDYLYKNKDRIPQGITPAPGSAIYSMIDRDASGQNIEGGAQSLLNQMMQIQQAMQQVAVQAGSSGGLSQGALNALNNYLTQKVKVEQQIDLLESNQNTDANTRKILDKADDVSNQTYGLLRQIYLAGNQSWAGKTPEQQKQLENPEQYTKNLQNTLRKLHEMISNQNK